MKIISLNFNVFPYKFTILKMDESKFRVFNDKQISYDIHFYGMKYFSVLCPKFSCDYMHLYATYITMSVVYAFSMMVL
jgi:hypothetical protein